MTNEVKIDTKVKAPKRRKIASLDKRKARAGWFFVLPFLIGFVLVYLPIVFDSFWLAFNEMTIVTGGGYELEFVGLENYKIVNSSAKAMIDYNYVYEATEEFDGKHTPIFYFNEYKNVDKSPKMTTEEIDGPDETTVRYNFATTPLYAL